MSKKTKRELSQKPNDKTHAETEINEKDISALPVNHQAQQPEICKNCFVKPKDALFVHGQIGHRYCCYPCAKAIYKQHRSCPVCRRKIEKIIKYIDV